MGGLPFFYFLGELHFHERLGSSPGGERLSIGCGRVGGGLRSGPMTWVAFVNVYQGQGCGSVDYDGGVEEGVEGIVEERSLDWGVWGSFREVGV